MTTHFWLQPPCAVCGRPAATIELVPPGQLPKAVGTWSAELQAVYQRHHSPESWRFRYEGPGGGNGLGDDCDEARARRYIDLFVPPLDFDRIRAEIFDCAGYCAQCSLAYCPAHWQSERCPKGHSARHDPHWYPDDLWDD